jgi:hypothetical protein
MKRTILSIFAGFGIVCLTVLNPVKSQAQLTENHLSHEEMEKIFSFWSVGMEQVRMDVGASRDEYYKVFYNFQSAALDSIHRIFMSKVRDRSVNASNAKEYVEGQKPYIAALYNKFRKIETEYPTSVDEYKTNHKPRIGGDSCFSSCYNTNFADGTFDGWYGYYANNSSTITVTSFDITGITGGYLGAVTQAAYDPNTATYQLAITSGSATDPFLNTYSTYSMPQVSPFGGIHSVELGDGTTPEYGAAILSQSFYVSPNTASLTYQYALFVENPAGHSYWYQPFFQVAVLDQNGDTIPICGQYSVAGDSARYKGGFKGIYYSLELDTVYWRNWTFVNVPLKNYIGQCVTIVFEDWDCALGGHFSYAYVDASCTPLQLISSSANFCGQDSLALTAPIGATTYEWTGPNHGILSDTNLQTIWVDSAGTYSVVCIPVTGIKCADTLTITIGKLPGPPPYPKFSADTVCAGQPMTFTNLSDSMKAQYSWDFYNIGVYNISDTNTNSVQWTYLAPGVYTVKLHEVLANGCGNDTLIKVYVDTNVTNPTFTANPVCFGDTTYFTPSAAGATLYDWNFGDPTSGIHDSSKHESPGHLFTAPGTYTVTLEANNRGNCGAEVTQIITIYAVPTPKITGKDTICPGTSDSLFASGGSTYVWNNGSTNAYLPAAPTSTKSFTLTAYNGSCAKDTVFTVTVVPAPTPKIAYSKDTVCKNDTLTIWGTGGTKYEWTTGSTSHIISRDSTIIVTLRSDTTFKLYEFGGTCEDSISVSLYLRPATTGSITEQYDSVCPNTTDVLTLTGVGGQVGYKWSTGETTAAISVTPTVTTTYTAMVFGKCDSVPESITVAVDPTPIPKIKGTDWKCLNVKDTLFASGGVRYLWSTGATTTQIITGGITGPTTYTLYAFNALNCEDSTVFTVDLRDAPNITVSSNLTKCGGQPVPIVANASGSNPPFTFTWSTGTTSTSPHSDTIYVSPDSATLYTVKVSNGCVSKTVSTVVTPDNPLLYACCDKSIIKGDDTTIVANNAGDTNIKTPYIWTPDTAGFTCLDPACDSVRVSPTVTTTYTVTGTDKAGCQTSRVVTITVETPCFLMNIPNVITPSDPGPYGLNNVFYIKTENLTSYSITIFDRWGKEMYTSTNQYAYWPGTTKSGVAASDGVYYYILTGSCANSNITYKKDGFVQLIR